MNTNDNTEQRVTVEFGSPGFWALYDELCTKENLKKLIEGNNRTLVSHMQAIVRLAHRTGMIHSLARLDRGWERQMAWLVLRDAPIQKQDGQIWIQMRPGDVVIMDRGEGMDVIATHVPEQVIPSGYLLSGRWDPMIGLFLPLFEMATVMDAIRLRLEQNTKNSLILLDKGSRNWGWPIV